MLFINHNCERFCLCDVDGPRISSTNTSGERPGAEMVHVVHDSPPRMFLLRYRVEITKIISLVYVVDDIFDLIGTLEELSLFTKAIKM